MNEASFQDFIMKIILKRSKSSQIFMWSDFQEEKWRGTQFQKKVF